MWRDAWNASEEVCWNIAIKFWNGRGRVPSSMTPYEFSRHGHLVHSRRKLSMYAFSWMHSSNAKQLHYDKILVTQWYRIGVLSVMDKFICHLLLAIFLILFEAFVDYSFLVPDMDVNCWLTNHVPLSILAGNPFSLHSFLHLSTINSQYEPILSDMLLLTK